MIRNSLYIKYLDDISRLSDKLRDALDSLPSCSDDETMEETEIRHSLDKAAEALNYAKIDIIYFSRPVKQGRLASSSGGKFYVSFNEGGKSYDLSCSSPIEIYLNGDFAHDIEAGWYAGRVEHNGEGYYFYGPGKPLLFEGMKVRTRK